ncbi:IS200/IS605 family accessory protein TnpB-related protein, partial [Streptomyces sp. NPDC096339]
MGGVRVLSAPFVALGPTGVAVRTRLKYLTGRDEEVLALVGAHLGSLAAKDLAVRCRDGLDHSADSWAVRKRELTARSSSRWAGSITKATHDQWAPARRGQTARVQSLEAGIKTIRHRLAQPIGARGTKAAPGGFRTRRDWHAKARRLRALEDRLATIRADLEAGRVRGTRGGRRLLGTRHHLDATQLGEEEWRLRWEAARWFLQADGESAKRFGNETIRVTPDGEVSVKLPAPLAHLANGT